MSGLVSFRLLQPETREAEVSRSCGGIWIAREN